MIRRLSCLRLAAAAGLLLALARPSFAGEQKHVVEARLDAAPWTARVDVPQFDPAQGRLLGVRVTLRSRLQGSFGVENLGNEATNADGRFAMRIGARSILPCVVTPELAFQDPLGAYDGQLDYSGASGRTHAALTCEATSAAVSSNAPLDLQRFTGTGRVGFLVQGASDASAQGENGQVQSTSTLSAIARMEVVYEFVTIVACDPSQSQPCTSAAGAREITFTDSISMPSVQWTPGPLTELRIPKFPDDPLACRTLIQVDVSVIASRSGSVGVENGGPSSCTDTITSLTHMRAVLQRDPETAIPFDVELTSAQTYSLAPFDGVVDFAGPSGALLPVNQTELRCSRFIDQVGAAELRFFVQSTPADPTDDELVFTTEAFGGTSHQGCSVSTLSANMAGSLRVEVTYRFCQHAPPVAVDDQYTLVLGEARSLPVYVNDVAGDNLVDCAQLRFDPVCPLGTITRVDACGSAGPICPGTCLRFTPNSPPQPGTTTFHYWVTDRNGCEDQATVTIVIGAPFELSDDAAATCAGAAVDVCVFANDTALVPLVCPPVGSSAGIQGLLPGWSVTWVTAPCAGGPLTCTNLDLRVVPAPGFSGTGSFTYVVSDVQGTPHSAVVTVEVFSGPVLNDDTASTCQGTPVVVCVFANDSSASPVACPSPGTSNGISGVPAGWTATWIVQGSCAEGANTCTDLALRVVPPAGFTGSQSITYSLGDEDGCVDSATVLVLVRTPPVLVDDVANTCTGSSVDVCVFANDVTDTQILCPVPGSATGISGLPPGWSALWVPNASCPEGALTCTNLALRVTPLASFTGTQVLSYTLSNTDTCSDVATVTVQVRTPPGLQNDSVAVCLGAGPIDVCVFANDISDTALVCPAAGSSSGITNVPAGWTAQWTSLGCASGPGTCPGLGLRITAPAGFTGTISPGLRYTLSDTDGCLDFADVAVTVRTPPVLNSDLGRGCQGSGAIDVCVFANDASDTPLVCPPPGTSIGISNVLPGWSAVWAPGACGGGPSTCNGVVLRVIPPPGFVGSLPVPLRYTLADTEGCTDFADVLVDVCAVLAGDDSGSVCPGATGTFPVLANDTTTCGTLDCTTMQLVAPVPVGFSLVGCGLAGCPGCAIQFQAPPTFAAPVSVAYRIANDQTPACQATAVLTVSPSPSTQCEPSCTSDSILNGGASLLLYPEFDNRPGAARTLLTVTNTNSSPSTGTVQVEFVYVGRNPGGTGADYCQEFNRTATLTPGDTLTVLTNVHNPFPQQGYVYAFARDVAGPIAFDHLIGNLVHMDGIAAFHWSVNPFAFASPRPEGLATDVDGDGLRDLNGVEYVRAPDQILVPRFLGQDALGGPGFTSDLILIPLTGGVQFTTLVDFFIFNDNEQVFSAQTTVQCWDKRTLVSISSAFREAFLQSLPSDDPGEIDDPNALGPRNAGWFRLEGNVAYSALTSFIDPTVLAVLIERQSERYAADLPFAEGERSNGALLSFAALGN